MNRTRPLGHQEAARRIHTANALLAAIKFLSRFSACRATNRTLATVLGWPVSRVKKGLNVLKQQRRILVNTSDSEYVQVEGVLRWVRRRTIYVVSFADRERGALLTANFVRRIGRTTTVKDDKACGQLQCTPAQWNEWLALACERGWLAVSVNSTWERVIKRIGNFPMTPAPQANPPPRLVLERRDVLRELVALVKERERPEYGLFLRASDSELAKLLKTSRSHAQATRQKAVTEGLIHANRADGAWTMSTSPLPERTTGDWRTEVIDWVRKQGQVSSHAVTAFVRMRARRKIRWESLRGAGLVLTKFGRQQVASVGPLPDEYRTAMAEKVRSRKLQRDADRRRLQKLGIDRTLRDLVESARALVADRFFQRHRCGCPQAYEYRVLQTADDFMEWLTMDLAVPVAREVIVARPSMNAVELADELVNRLTPAFVGALKQRAAA